MSKTVRKFMHDDIWSLGRNESWFTDMSEKGLHLRRIGSVFATFEKGEPRKTKYRMDIINSAPTEEQLEIYKDSGWQLVTNFNELYIFSSSEGVNVQELHTDPIEQSYTLAALNKRMRNQVIILSILIVLYLGMILWMLFLERTPTLAMIKTPGILYPMLIFVELYSFYTVIRSYMTVRRLKKSLSEGNPMDHRVNWRKPRLINGFISAFFLLTALLTVCSLFAGIAQSKTYTIPQTSINLPIVSLADIERNPAFEREVDNSQDVDLGNRVSYDWSLLAPVQYEVSEHGIIKNMLWEDNSGSYSPCIETNYYQLTFSSMAVSLTDDLMKRYVDKFHSGVIVQKTDQPFFDKLFVADDGTRKQIFAYWGNKVIYIDYYGKKPAENIIALLVSSWQKKL